MTRALAQARWELGLLLRNGEQLLLALAIPTALLIAFRDPVTVASASVIATMFTSLAIATGFERRSGALRFLGVTPLTRGELLAGKLLAQLAVLALSLAVAAVAGLALGGIDWPAGATAATWLAAIALAAWALAAWALALAGTIRAEATLAVANGLFLLLVAAAALAGSATGAARIALLASPGGALAGALAGGTPWLLAVLAAWGIAGTAIASRSLRWS